MATERRMSLSTARWAWPTTACVAVAAVGWAASHGETPAAVVFALWAAACTWLGGFAFGMDEDAEP